MTPADISASCVSPRTGSCRAYILIGTAGLCRLTTIFFQGMFTGKNIFPLKIDTHVDGIGVKKGTTRNEQGSSRVGKIAQPWAVIEPACPFVAELVGYEQHSILTTIANLQATGVERIFERLIGTNVSYSVHREVAPLSVRVSDMEKNCRGKRSLADRVPVKENIVVRKPR